MCSVSRLMVPVPSFLLGRSTGATSWARMAKRPTSTPAPTPHSIAADLSVPERVLLFCLASRTDWTRAGVTHAAVRHMVVRNLVERGPASNRYVLTEQGRAVLDALLHGA